jgi:thymidylate synthase
LGEFLWYISGRGDLEFIKYFIPRYAKYSEPDGTIWGAYGPRFVAWHGQNQLENVIAHLSAHSETRQAVIQVFDALDIAQQHLDTPCTCVIQFLARNSRLNLIVMMRSNDAYIGLPHDIFSFTMIQEMVARRLGIRLGWYKHVVGSLHLYDTDRTKAERYVAEGWQSTIGVAMPPMPRKDPLNQIGRLLSAQEYLRNAAYTEAAPVIAALSPYWRDLAVVLKAYSLLKHAQGPAAIHATKSELHSHVFATYIDSIAHRASLSAKVEHG